ncbi:MAG: HTTM domain-containing protein [Pyrinomonadaceae bacterium]
MVRRLAKRVESSIDDWLTAPEANAAGRLGLFRILFSVFYLWHLSPYHAASQSDLPAFRRSRILLIEYLPQPLPPIFFELLESILVAALVALMIGFCVRVATALVLVSGSVLEALNISFSGEHATVFLAFYIPFFMLLSGRWGHTYSLDALLRRRGRGLEVEPPDPGWSYFSPVRSVVVLSALFFSSAIFKVIPGNTWLSHSSFMPNLVHQKSVKAVILGLPQNPLAVFISETPMVYKAVCYQVVLFEGLFILSLFNRKLRQFFLALALFFHSVGALWFVVTFTPILIVYALFVDWQALRQKLWSGRIGLLDPIPSGALICATVILAGAAGVFWNSGESLRTALNAGGLLDWRTIWYPVLPLSLAWCLVALLDLIQSITRVSSVHYFRARRVLSRSAYRG